MTLRATLRTALLAGVLSLAGCAGTPPAGSSQKPNPPQDDSLQQVLRIDVLGQDGKALNGLSCRLSNDQGYFLAQSGGTVRVKRSGRDLEIECDTPQGSSARAQLRARTLGRTVGAADSSSGSASSGSSTSVYGGLGVGSGGSRGGVGISIGFPIVLGGGMRPAPEPAASASNWRYPEWVQLRVGKTLLFDAQGSSSAQPAVGYEAVAKPR